MPKYIEYQSSGLIDIKLTNPKQDNNKHTDIEINTIDINLAIPSNVIRIKSTN